MEIDEHRKSSNNAPSLIQHTHIVYSTVLFISSLDINTIRALLCFALYIISIYCTMNLAITGQKQNSLPPGER